MKQRRLGSTSKLRAVAAIAVAALGIALAGCTTSAPDPVATGSGDATTTPVEELTVAYIGSGTATLPLFIGIDRGYFEEESLVIDAQTFGSAPYPQTVAGEVDIVSGDHVGAIQAAVGGLPLLFLAETSQLIAGNHQFVTPEDSPFKTAKDLKGARIGIANLAGSAKFALDALLEEGGLTADDVQVSQIAYDALGPALELGNIDVAHLPGTFLDAARQAQPLHVVADFADLPGLTGMAQAGYYTTQAAYEANPGKFDRFVAAYQRASQDAIDDQDMLTEYFVRISKMDAGVAARLPLPSQVVESDPANVQKVVALMLKSGLIDKSITVGEGTLKVADIYQ